MDEHTQRFKAKVGLDVTQTPRDTSFCTHAILEDELLVVRDASEDERFAGSPLVTTDPKVLFYAGAPLRTPEGYTLGTLCVMDHLRRDLTVQQAEGLRSLAHQGMALLQLRRRVETEAEQLYSVLEDMPDGIVLVNAEGTIRFVNTQLETQFGYGPAELLGRKIECLLPERFRGGHRRLRHAAAPSRRPMGEALILFGQRKDGSEFPVDISLSPVERNGEVTVIAAVRDLSQRRQLEAERDSLAAFAELSPHPVIEVARDGEGIFVNAVGRELARLGGKEDVSALLPADFMSLVERSISQEKVISGLETVTADRVTAWTLCPVPMGNSVIAFGFDLTEHKRADRALRQSEKNYRDLVEHAAYGIYRSSQEGTFLDVNSALVEMLGYESQEELRALDLGTDVYSDPEQREELLQRFADADRIDELEVNWTRKDGSVITVVMSGRPVHLESGEVGAWEMIAQDVTALRAVESQLRQAQKMEAIGQLTGGIAHDFNNLLTVIQSNAELALDSLSPEQAELRKDVEEIRGAAHRGAALIKKLLGFSRSTRLEVGAVDIVGLVVETKEMLRRLLPASIEIDLQIDPHVGAVRADSGAVEQVLLNLATNARDAMPEGGRIRIDVEKCWVDPAYEATHPWVEPSEYVSVAVSDSGIGMDKYTAARVFEPFFTTKPLGQGTGLGMAMVYGLVKQQGGYVHVYSEQGQGTVVKVLLPISPDAESGIYSPAMVPEDYPGGGETILVVDDEASIRRAAKRVLERGGYEILLAADGEQALKVFGERESDIDMIISDMVMPNLGGRELYEALKLEGKQVKILFTSGYSAFTSDDATGLESDAPFLRKPWTAVELLKQVRALLGTG